MAAPKEPVVRFQLPTSSSVLLSALEWGEVMVVKDTVTYFGRNAGSGAVRDLFLPDRQMVRGTLVLLPLLFRCRPLGCVYLLAPWDIHAALGKAALQEAAALLASGTFKALLAGGPLQQQWYAQVLSEGPMPAPAPPALPAPSSAGAAVAAELVAAQGQAAAAAEAAAVSAAAMAPVGLPVSGHACGSFPELVLWPELLDIKDDLARSRHTAVYTAEHASSVLAVKLFRVSSSMDHGHTPGGHAPGSAGVGGAAAGLGGVFGSGSGGSGSSGNVLRETELEAVLSLQYRLCSVSHPHVLQHVAVYPHVYEVVHRRSSREPPDVYLTSMLPRKERHHRCAALVTEYAAGGCLRDAVNRGALHVPTAAALHAAAAAAGLGPVPDMLSLGHSQLAVLLSQLEQQLPLPTAVPQMPMRLSHEASHSSAPLPAALGGLLGVAPPGLGHVAAGAGISAGLPTATGGLPGKRRSHEAVAADALREPHMPLLRSLLLQIALGMQHLHANGIVHGELRLDNVMVAGQLPSTMSLLQQQQEQQRHEQQQQQQPAQQQEQHAGPQQADVVGCVSGLNGIVAQHEAGSNAAHFESSRSSSASSAAGQRGSGDSFSLKLKDIGLCTIGWSNRQVTMRKLAGRPRLQAVSWLAPECFRGDGLSKHSDVYAFGILMWELYTGQVAFNDLVTGSAKVLQTIISDGVRPQFPDNAPSWYVTLASRCWSGTAKSRPSFRRIVAQLHALEKPLLVSAMPSALE
ncbi:hypothetical protein OEZ85_001549 [Tetradesmus obliquus]|uniref:Protein kinase domain-containing protein n=1 Tax=Tetradesmus obliquus TaxID=3088 RepID=A0ABY8U0F6_TETOB|nr:hypothetical protein OEZ85_001549 [Tetradesmus obliquus]